MGALSTTRQCGQLAAVFLTGLLMALAPSAHADEYTYNGEVTEAVGAFSALAPVGTLLSGTLTMTPVPGGGTSTDTAILTEALLNLIRPSDNVVLICFRWNTVCPEPLPGNTVTEAPVISIDALNITFAANGCPISGTINLTANSPSFGVNFPITLNLGARTFFADGDFLGTVSGTGGLTCIPGSPDIDPSPDPATMINFGTVTTADAPQMQTIMIGNNGDAALNVGTVTISGTGGVPDFTKTAGADTCSGTSIPAMTTPMAGCSIGVTFTPTTIGTPSATLTIPSNDGDESPVTYNFQATVSAPPGTIGIAGPVIADTVSGMANTGTVTVSNTGAGPLTITSVNTNPANMLDAPFSITMNGCPVSPMTLSHTPSMNTCTITVQFQAPATGITMRTVFMDSFTIVSNDPVTPEKNVPVSAFALPPPVPVLTVSPNPLALTAMATGSSTAELTITNTGAADLIITGFSGLAAPFSVMSETCTTAGGGGPIAPPPAMESCTVTVQFAPPTATMFSNTLVIASNDAVTNPNVTVNGTGTMTLVPDINVTPTSLTFDPQVWGTTATMTVTVDNVGSDDLNMLGSSVTMMTGAAGEFSASGCPTTLEPSDPPCTITVTFAPTSTDGPVNATLNVMSNSPGEETVPVMLMGTGVQPQPDIAVTPASPPGLDLGMLTLGVDPAGTGTVTVTNNGTANLNISSVTIATGGSDFSVPPMSCMDPVPPPGGMSSNTCEITVSFLPTAVGTRTGTLTIVSDDPDTAMATVSLTGEGLMAPEPNISIATDTDMTGMALDLGSALFMQSATPKNITVTNTGNADLTFGAISKTGTDAAAFALGLGGMGQCDSGITLATMTSCTIAVTFTASAPAGAKTAMVIIPSNDPDTGSAMVTLNAMAVQPFPNIMVDPPLVGFGIVDAGTAATPRMVTIRNTGDAPLNVGTISLATGTVYGQTNTCGTPVMPTLTCVITLTFTPTAMVDAMYPDTLSIASDDPDMPTVTVTLSGRGSTTPLPNISSDVMSLGFGSVFMTQTSMPPQMVRITNNGTADLTITSIATVGTDSASFTVTSGCPIAPAVLARDASCMASVTMSPMRVGPLSAMLRFASDDMDTPNFDIGLTGTGLMPLPDISVPTTPVNFGPVALGMSSPMTVTVTNNGLANLNVTSVTTTPGSDYSVVGMPCATPVPPTGGAGNTCDITLSFMPTAAGTRTGTLTIGSDDPDTATVTVSLTGMGQAPDIGVVTDTDMTGAALDLGSALLTQAAMPKNITVTNSGNADLTFGTISKTGADAAAFALGGTCGMTLAQSASCTIAVTFTANAPAGAKTAVVLIPSNDPDTPSVSVVVNGTATAPAPVAGFSATELTLPTVEQGMTSTGFIEVTNSGTGDLVVSAIATSNGIAAPYTLTSQTCTAMPIPNGGSCRMNFSFAPTAVGSFSETFNFDSNDGTPSRVLSLQGTATMMPVPDIAVNTTALDHGMVVFGTPSTRTVTVTNNGGATLNVGAPSISPAGPFTVTSTCGAVAPLGGTCTVTTSFAPTVAGAAAATLTIPSNDPDRPTVTVALNGVGVMPQPEITVTPVLANFASVVVGNTSRSIITVRNDGMANLTIGTIVIGGTGSGEFRPPVTTCGTVTPGSTCTVTVTFAPANAGVASATLTIPSNDADESTVDVPLIGTATPAPMPIISTPVSADVGNVLVGMTGTATFTVTNTGTANLVISSVTPTGAGFGVSSQTCSAAPVASMATCTVTVSYTPTAAGTATGSVVIASNDPVNPSRSVLALANGTTAPMGSVSVTAINYQNVTIGVNSTKTITINNGGSGVLTVTGVTLSGANAADFNAPNTCVTISAGASCDLMVTFKPSTAGNKTAVLTITTDDPAMSAIVINLAAQASKIEEVVVAVTNEGKGSFGWLDLVTLALVIAIARRRRTLVMVAGAALLATPAIADELPADAYWYAGVGVGSSTGKASESAVRSGIEAIGVRVDSLNFDDSDSGWQAFVGYQATTRFGVEFGYVDLGQAGINLQLGAVTIDQLPLISRTISENVSFLGDGLRGSLTFRQPLGERASVHARVGLIAWEIRSGIGGTAGPDTVNISEVESGSDLTFGFGGEVWFGPGKFGVRAEWERFEFGEQDAQMWSINGLFRF